MAEVTRQGAIGDASRVDTMDTDVNGARTAVGVPHPENRPNGQTVPAADLSGFELDDYDDDKQGRAATDIPPNQDAGESFREITDVGEEPGAHRARSMDDSGPNEKTTLAPTVDNQTNQPDRFHNREPKAEAGSRE